MAKKLATLCTYQHYTSMSFLDLNNSNSWVSIALSSLTALTIFFLWKNTWYGISDLLSDVLSVPINVSGNWSIAVDKRHLMPSSRHICVGGILSTLPTVAGGLYRRVPIVGLTDKEMSPNSSKVPRGMRSGESSTEASTASGQA